VSRTQNGPFGKICKLASGREQANGDRDGIGDFYRTDGVD
jgi:hypothetical protein